MTQRLCRVCSGWHDLDEPWPDNCLGHYKSHRVSSYQIIKDIEPYRSTITREVIGGRRQHRDHLKAHGCIEVGNEKQKVAPRQYPTGLREDLKRAVEQKFG